MTSQVERLLEYEIWENNFTILVFIKEPKSGNREAYWHYTVISKLEDKVTRGDKTIEAKDELVTIYECRRIK